jgi:hypothetical protein
MKKNACFVFILLLSVCTVAKCEEQNNDFQTDFARKECLPDWVWRVIDSQALDEKYKVSFHLNPFYLRADFDGDNIQDIAVLIINKKTKQFGVLIIHRKSKKVFILGAGNAIGNVGGNFDWMDAWQIYDKGKVHLGVGETTIPILKGDALDVIKTESANGLIYWNGKKYLWYQQSD